MSKWADIAPYAGRKSDKPGFKYWSIYNDGNKYETAISLFGGLCAIGGRMLESGKVKRLIVAEADPTVRAVWMCWADATLHADFYRNIDYWKAELMDAPDAAQVTLKQFIQDTLDGHIPLDPMAIGAIAAAAIAFRKLSFMGISRANDDGEINVWLDCSKVETSEGQLFPTETYSGKLAALIRWNWHFPEIVPGSLIVVDDWAKCFDVAHDPETTVVIHDPPYYYPIDPVADAEVMARRKLKTTMAPAYIAHKPHDEALTLNHLCIAPLTAAIKCKRVILSNYDCVPLQAAIDALGVPHRKTVMGVLDHGNNAIEAVTKRSEAIWEFGAMRRDESGEGAVIGATTACRKQLVLF